MYMLQENQEEEQDTKRGASSGRRSRAAAVHNQSERVTISSLKS